MNIYCTTVCLYVTQAIATAAGMRGWPSLVNEGFVRAVMILLYARLLSFFECHHDRMGSRNY